MKKAYIITAGVMLILIVLAIWVYLLIFGSPENTDDVFSNLGFTGSPAVIAPNDSQNSTETLPPAPTQGPLRQLTTKPVAGFGYTNNEATTIRYVERGTGYIYEIDLSDDNETRLSDTTIPGVTDAFFSTDSTKVVLSIEAGYERELIAGTLNTNNRAIDLIDLPAGAEQARFISTSTLTYIIVTETETVGYSLTLPSTQPTQIFTIPLKDVTMVWAGEDDYFVYSKTTPQFPGALYRINNQLEAVTGFSYGFIGAATPNHLFASRLENGLVSFVKAHVTDTWVPLAVPFLPQKCAAGAITLWCAAPPEGFGGGGLENWFKGNVQSNDYLWLVDTSNGSATLFVDFIADAGRVVDVDRMVVDSGGSAPIFRNRIDGTLWIYDTRLE